MEKNRATDYLQAGYGETDLTPPLGTDLAGFGFYLDRRATVVRDRLKTRSLCLQGKEETILILSLDLLSLSVDFADRCRRQISRETGIPFKIFFWPAPILTPGQPFSLCLDWENKQGICPPVVWFISGSSP